MLCVHLGLCPAEAGGGEGKVEEALQVSWCLHYTTDTHTAMQGMLRRTVNYLAITYKVLSVESTIYPENNGVDGGYGELQ